MTWCFPEIFNKASFSPSSPPPAIFLFFQTLTGITAKVHRAMLLKDVQN